MVDVKREEELREWLAGNPKEWARAIATRSALRILPLGMDGDYIAQNPTLPIAIFRATAVAWLALNSPALDARDAATAADEAAEAAAELFPEAEVARSVANSAADAAFGYSFDSGNAGSRSAFWAADAAAYFNAEAAIWAQISADREWLDSERDQKSAARRLGNRPLWKGPRPEWLDDSWLMARSNLIAMDANYRFWIDWYERRVIGERSSFEIPGDTRRKEDKQVLRQIAEAPNTFWARDTKFVLAELVSWLNDARERVSGDIALETTDPIMGETALQLRSAASPQAIAKNGKLDAGPNSQYDQPTYSGDLANLPSELRSFSRVLSLSLGKNASAFMRASLAEYENEVLVRGNQPILGVLKGLASAIAREVWSPESMAASDDPDEWEMRDEREWGPGMADLFRTFFRYHQDLITHFPLDEEREEILRSLPIDEQAASGDALIDPVELVTGLIRDLHGQGMATDDILKIVEAHEQYNANIASLPPVGADVPSDYVTPKRRHVLMTAGFYLHLYSVLGSTASLSSVIAANPALVTQIHMAAEGLMRFVI